MADKKMLLAGGGYADIPMICAAKKLGYTVYTSGNRPNEMGHGYSDGYYPADFSDPEAVYDLAKSLGVSALCACCNDFSALSAAYAAEKLGLPGHDAYETAKIIHHKDSYREFAAKNGIRTPAAKGFSDQKEALEYVRHCGGKYIVKPVDLTGGKGISVGNDGASLSDAVDRAFAISRSKRIVIEEFVEGTRHGFSAFIVGGKVVFHFTDNEYYYLNQHLVSAASTPGTVPDSAVRRLCADSEKIVSLLSLKDGIFHVQFILSNGEPVIIEICRRAPGDLYVRLVEIATGVPNPQLNVKGAAGIDCSMATQQAPEGYFTRHCVMCSANGRVRDVIYDPSIRDNIVEKFMWWQKGDIVEDYMTAKMGIVFLSFASRDEMLSKTAAMQELIRVEIE